MILKESCQHKGCKVHGVLKSSVNLGSNVIKIFECGHSIVQAASVSSITVSDASITVLEESTEIERILSDGKPIYADERYINFKALHCNDEAYAFQKAGVRFAIEADYKCLIADAMGLGKTIQGIFASKEAHKRTLIVVKGSTIFQWAKEIKKWWNDHPIGVMPIMNRETILPGFEIYLISMDFISRKGVIEKLSTLGIELIVVDECQNFKDSSSKRTKALITLIQENEIKHRIFLSGTPIKNRANEYFTILNLLDPARFHSYVSFCRTWLIPNEKGAYTRIDPYMIEKFREVTSKYILRREKQDVLTNLPPLVRDYQYVVIEDPILKNIYNKELDLFANFRNTGAKMNSTQILGWLAKMRSITGQTKIPWAIEYAEQFLDETEDSLALGIHHHAVRDRLYFNFETKNYHPLKLSGEDDIYRKNYVQEQFNAGNNRLLIINAIAGGVGLNLQSCANAVVLERQWSSADEEQFEARFHRDGQKKSVNIVYPIATGTIDEWFHDLIGKKREILKETMGDNYPSYDPAGDEDLLNDLVETTLRNKL